MQARRRESRVACPSCRTASFALDGIGESKRQHELRSKSSGTQGAQCCSDSKGAA